jgi:hypothetical protein
LNSYWLRRFRRHFSLGMVAVAITYLAYAATPPPDVRHRLSIGTAYAGLIFLAVSLWLGPWNVLRRRAGRADKTLVEFKPTKNSQLERNLEKQTTIHEKASDAKITGKGERFF